MDPEGQFLNDLEDQANAHNVQVRIFSNQGNFGSVFATTNIRFELTSIEPIGMVIYSIAVGDYQNNLKFIINKKIQQLYENANMTNISIDESEIIDKSRFEDEDKDHKDINNFEKVIENRDRGISANKGIYLFYINCI